MAEIVKINGATVKLARHSQGGFRKFIFGRMFALGRDKYIAAALATEITTLAEKEKATGETEWSAGQLKRVRLLIQAAYGDEYAAREQEEANLKGRHFLESFGLPADRVRWFTGDEVQATAEAAATGKLANATTTQAANLWKESVDSSARSPKQKYGLKQHFDMLNVPEMPLSMFGFDAISEIVDAQIGKAKAGEISPFTAGNRLGALRQFLKWAKNTGKIEYTPFADYDEWFTDQIKKLGSMKKAAKRAKRERSKINLDTLSTLYRAANDRQRLYMCLALNTGQLNKEIATMLPDHIKGSVLCRDRHKTLVRAEWVLWNETADLLSREAEGKPLGKPFILTDNGSPLVRENEKGIPIDNVCPSWRRLLVKAGFLVIKKTRVVSSTPGLQFELLRKFASQWIRDRAGKDYSEAFLSHSDGGVSDHYNTFTDWQGLGKVLADFRTFLQPMFDQGKAEAPDNAIDAH